MSIVRTLRREGVLGINARNIHYTLRCNPRRLYPLVDDKLATKRLCAAAGIPTPALLAVARHHFELRELVGRLGPHDTFVLKPARGAMGNGILVVPGRRADGFLLAGGRWIRVSDLLYHAAGIISGLYSLGGQPDVALVEERLEVHPQFGDVSTEGVPDVRVVVFRGVPVMAMTRLPTAASRGRANLHQGAVGAGVDLVSGRIRRAVVRNRPVARHPDSRHVLIGRAIPHFDRVVEIAVRASDETGLGYVGSDVVVDARRGPVILELNARPGLAVQLANGAGLLPRLRAVERERRDGWPLGERIAFGRALAAGPAR